MKPRSTFTLAAFTLLLVAPAMAGDGNCSTCVDGPEMFEHRSTASTDPVISDIRAEDIAEFPNQWSRGFSSPAPEPAPLNAFRVVFEVDVGADRKISSMRVESITDMRSGESAPESLAVPEGFVAAAKKIAESREYEQRLVYFYFDPARPGRADLNFVIED